MSATQSFCSNLKVLRLLGPSLALLSVGGLALGQGAYPSAIGSQANTDVAAQRRMQETMQEAQRQRRIEEQIQRLRPALESEKLSGPDGPVLARQALAALVRLREEGISPEEALGRATRSMGIDPATAAKPSAYLRHLLSENSGKITAALLTRLAAGEDPAPAFTLPPYRP